MGGCDTKGTLLGNQPPTKKKVKTFLEKSGCRGRGILKPGPDFSSNRGGGDEGGIYLVRIGLVGLTNTCFLWVLGARRDTCFGLGAGAK